MNDMLPTPVQRNLKLICVYCGSSTKTHPEFREAARETGRLLALNGSSIIFGGGSVGSMGALADGALEAGGHVIGVMPEFMHDLEWGHSGLTELRIVSNLHQRKLEMIEKADGIIALPGGSGTFEELLEALTRKRLALYLNPIVLLNTRGYYDAFQTMMEQAIKENFMLPEHLKMWSTVKQPRRLITALLETPEWEPERTQLAVQ